MTALAKERQGSFETWNYKQWTLQSGKKAYKGAIALLDLAAQTVIPGVLESAAGNLLYIGTFAETVDATSAAKTVNVNMNREVRARWYENSAATALASTDVGKLCYVEDDQTVSGNPAGACVAGRVWAVSSTDGVLVELLQAIPEDAALLRETALAAFSANNINVGDYPMSGAVYDVPTTGAASTVTLPANCIEGTALTFVADGTKNGHTVQYRDATGTVVVTTALTASKRHQVRAVFLNSIWTASAYISP